MSLVVGINGSSSPVTAPSGTFSGTVQAEQLTSTDDADVADQLKMNEAPGAHGATPTIAFGDLDSGFWESSDDVMNWGSAGTAVIRINASGQAMLPRTAGAQAATPTLAFGDLDSGFYEAADDLIGVSIAGTVRWQFDASGIGPLSGTPFFTTGAVLHQGTVTAAQFTANQTDVSPGSSTRVWRVSSDASRNIYSMAMATDGREVEIHNVGAQNVVLVSDDGANGTATLRFKLPAATKTIPPDGCAVVRYDNTTQRIRLVSLTTT